MHFQFRKSLDILWQTFPFVLTRLVVYGLAIAVSFLWWGGVFFLFMDWPFPGPSWLAWVIGGVLYGSGAKLVKHYVLYLVRAAHISVITRIAVEGDLPPRETQFSYGSSQVFGNFLRVSLLFGIDRLVNIILKAFNKSVFKLVSFIPGVESFKGFFKQVMDYSVGYIDEAILSYSLLYPQRNPWQTAREGLVLYVQNWRTILGSGLLLAAASYLLVGLIAAPGVIAGFLMGGQFKPAVIAGSVGIGFLVKFAIMDPFALTSVIVNFHSAIEGQIPDPEWEKELSQVSKKFDELRNRAGEWAGSSAATPPPPPGTNPSAT